ncbi:mannose receptor, C type [Mytilus galloprovincialis]|uniref:Mannose receptor, C type n=1 Tax=Mytilus galloprovincialis TaxID=29158 RepID=A0A8B6FUL3_MYTGA|nr:mannose receptor, C type [Mytilus galloprovincialis]
MTGRKIVYTYMLLILRVENTFTACPDSNWSLRDGVCYLADTAVTRNWDDAVQWCIGRNSLLVYPKTLTEKSNVLDILTEKGIGSCWIGLDDKQTEGVYVWQDSSVLQPDEEGWIPGNPDQISFGEDCTELWPNQGWNDATCDWEKNVICQVKEVVPTTNPETTSITTEAESTTTLQTTTFIQADPLVNGRKYCMRFKTCLGGAISSSPDDKFLIRCASKCLQFVGCCAFFFNSTISTCEIQYKYGAGYMDTMDRMFFDVC